MPAFDIRPAYWLIGASLVIGCARPRHDTGEDQTLRPASGLVLPQPAALPAEPHNGAQPLRRQTREPMLPTGFVRVSVGGLVPTPNGNAVLLVQDGTRRAVPIFIGDTEALSIRLRLEKRHFERPLTHDLLDSMLRRLGGHVESVRVERLEDNIFYGIVVVRSLKGKMELDARSSDAVALAVGNGAPIFMSKTVLEQAGRDLDEGIEPEERSEQDEPVAL